MIWYYIILFATTLLNVVFSWLPVVEELPAFAGYDIDAALVSGMSLYNAIAEVAWPLADLKIAVLALLGGHVILLVLKVFMGNRAPTRS